MQPAITVEGVRELRSELRKLKDKSYDDELKALHASIAAEVVARAEPNVPYRSGDLRRSLRGSGTKAAAVGRVGRTSVPYAAVIHWGWKSRGIVARPFLQDAAERLEADVEARYADAIHGLLGRSIDARGGL